MVNKKEKQNFGFSQTKHNRKKLQKKTEINFVS